MKKHAIVVPYSESPEDPFLSLKVECLTCEIEFGWTTDRIGALDQLEELAKHHDLEVHEEDDV